MTELRSVLFLLGALAITAPFGILVPAGRLFGREPPFTLARLYTKVMLRWVEISCGIRYEVSGWEHVPKTPVVIMSKHQSAWETLAFQHIFPPQVHVLKRELLWIPFFGWGLALMSPIPIDRARGVSALRSIARRGRERLDQGFWVVVFPEGTRVAPGERRTYQLGGAWLAAASGAPIVPVAHNAGRVWPRNAFIKHPGIVTVRIGPPIESANRDPKVLNAMAEKWIEEQQKALT